MTLDEAIERYKNYADYDCYNDEQFENQKEYEQLAEWLEELKAIKSNGRYVQGNKAGQKIGYNNAIDEFVKKISESNQGHWRVTRYEHGEAVAETMSYDIGTIKLIAEQLKGSVGNEVN